jgi:two-component system, cell cycle response regulator
MGARILVVEDNGPNRELMTYLLTAFGHTAEAARDGEEGWLRVRAEPFDLLLCDVLLPGPDGFDLVRRMKSDPALARVPLLAVTALALVGDRERMLSAGFDGYLTKPINPETFVRQVEAFLPPQKWGARPRQQ